MAKRKAFTRQTPAKKAKTAETATPDEDRGSKNTKLPFPLYDPKPAPEVDKNDEKTWAPADHLLSDYVVYTVMIAGISGEKKEDHGGQ